MELGNNKGPVSQNSRIASRPNLVRARTYAPAAQKRKRLSTQLDHKFEYNPLLIQTQPNLALPTFKPTSSIVVDLNTSTDIVFSNSPSSSSSGGIPPLSPNPNTIKAPSDINSLPTQTYHEYARSLVKASQLSQDPHIDRTRDRSNSPSRGHLVAGGSENEGKIRGAPGVAETPQGNETITDGSKEHL